MGTCVQKETAIDTVGALIESLKRFPPDMPIAVGFDDFATVYLDKPSKGEHRIDERGTVNIAGEDPWCG